MPRIGDDSGSTPTKLSGEKRGRYAKYHRAWRTRLSSALGAHARSTSAHTADRAELPPARLVHGEETAMVEDTNRMQRPALLGLLRELLEHDLVTRKMRAPVQQPQEVGERDRETAIIATRRQRSPAVLLVSSFVVSFIAGFAITLAI
jgi:hypothetical protein